MMPAKEEEKVELYYQNQARHFVDTLFDKGYFGAHLRREELREAEELLAYLFQDQANAAAKVVELLRRVKDLS